MRAFIVSLAIVVFGLGICLADTITLKNENSINGIIVEEGTTWVELNVGCGTVTLPRADIESIQRADNSTNMLLMKRWKRHYFESFPAPTESEEKILEAFRELKSEKEEISRAAMQKETLKKEIALLQTKISSLQGNVADTGRQIKATDPAVDIMKYNTLIVEFNTLSADLRGAIDKLNRHQKELEEFGSRSVGYVNKFLDFKEMFEKEHKEALESSPSFQQQEFYHNMAERLEVLTEDIKQREIEFMSMRGNIVVETFLNNKVRVPMVVDTGAGLTVISKDVASKLGVVQGELRQDIELILADGSRIPGKFFLLESVKISGVEATGV
jgi:hypothetical protein